MSAGAVLGIVVAFCLGYLLLTKLVYIVLAVIAGFENGVRRRESGAEDYDRLASSQFTIPVSVILAAYNEETAVVPTVESLLELNYPEHEVIVVNDGSSDGTLERLRDVYDLEPYEIFVRRVFDTEQVRAVYRSTLHPNLLVVDKENGGKADALNAGLNVARYRYVCGVDADTVFDRDALLKGMRLVVQDPARVIGVTSHLTIALDPEQTMAAPVGQRQVEPRAFVAYQHLDYLRAFFNNRLAWSRLGFMLCAVGAFQIWRRDTLEEVGGYARGFTCEDIELTFRVHERFLREKRDYAVLCLPDNVGTTEGPDTVRKLVAQRERWQRVIDETVWHYRGMWFRRRYRSVGFVGAPFYLFTEVLSPVVELLAVASLPVALALGVFQLPTFLVMLAAIAFTSAALTACAILFDDLQSRTYRPRDLARLLLLAPLDLVLYRPIIFWARMKGSWRFLRGDKDWHKFERNTRAQTV
jgi:cellulose synthase/poly-beta-1,6-N-acetylglucosamine synthase-like glycosyltransferase